MEKAAIISLFFQVVHAQHAGFHVAHADGVEELGDAEHGEGVGLAAGEKLRRVKEKPQVVKRQRKFARQQQGNGRTAGRRRS